MNSANFFRVASAATLVIGIAACSGGISPAPVTTTTTMSQALWVANGTNVLEFLPAQLGAGISAPAPHLVLNSATGFGAPQGVSFDVNGDLFVVDGGTQSTGGTVAPAIDEFSPAQLAALSTSPAPTPIATIAYAGFVFPQQAIFDASGNLWVADNGAGVLDKFMPSGGVFGSTPSVTLSSNPAFAGPLGLAFSATGDLWVANNAGTTIEKFSANILPTTSATVTPSAVLSDDGSGSIQGPWGLAFDRAGNLWSSNANAPNTIVEFAAASLSTGSPKPAVVLSPTTDGGNPSLDAPNGIAFDSIGDLAAVNAAGTFGLPLFGSNQLVYGGAISPKTLLTGTETTLNLPAGDVFGPAVK